MSQIKIAPTALAPRLSPALREAVRLVYVEGATISAAAKEVGLNNSYIIVFM